MTYEQSRNHSSIESLDRELFQSHHRGPFSVQRSSDGVDETFEIRSSVTDNFVAATHFWGSAASALMRATVVARSLNRSTFRRWIPPTVRRYFLLDHPPPYRVVRRFCEMQGPLLAVESSNRQGVIAVDGDDTESQVVAQSICEAINNRFHRKFDLQQTSLIERIIIRGGKQ
ncbi:MAG: hypothetical protein AAF802_03985 [Planctomycetota bacterium]